MKKKILLLTLVALGFGKLSAQETETLINGKLAYSGWWVEMPFAYSQVAEQDAFSPGLAGGIILNNSLRVGFIGYSFSERLSNLQLPQLDNGNGGYIDGNLGGLYIAPVIKSNKKIHLSIPIMIGAGRIEAESTTKYVDSEGELENLELGEDEFLVVQAIAEVEFNLMQNLRIGLGAGYRFTNEQVLEGLSDKAFQGALGQVSVRFGKF